MTKKEAKAIADYRRRRIQRLRARFDADEEENGNNAGGGKGGHGNTKLPFGLCRREGITVDPKWTPKDAWNALEGKGYSAKESYAELRKSGTVTKKGGPSAKMKSQRMQTAGIPSAMRTGAGLKKFTAFNLAFKEMEMEEHISDFVANAGAVMGGGYGQIADFSLAKTRVGGGDQLKVWHNSITGAVVKARLSVPDLNKVPEQYRESEARTFAHELVHYMNLCQRPDKGYGDFTDTDDALSEAVRNARDKVHKGGIDTSTAKVISYLHDMSEQWKKTRREYNSETKRLSTELNDKWMKRSEELGERGKLPMDEYKQYKKEKNELEAKRTEELEWINGSFGDGATALSNMYDAITFGRLKDKGAAWFGHGTSYFKGNEKTVKNEMLSIYVELHMCRDKKFLNMFRQDQPELAKALDQTVRTMLQRGKVEGYWKESEER